LKADYPGTSQIFNEMEAEEDEHRRELIEKYRRRDALSFAQSYGREEIIFALDGLGSSGGFPGFGFLLPRMRDQGPPREWERKILRKRNCDELRSTHSVEHEKPAV
jgi:hypothetical protein